MSESRSYKQALLIALLLHAAIFVALVLEPNHSQPALVTDAKNAPGPIAPPEAEIVKAVSVDQQELAATMNRLRDQRLQKQQAEEKHQQALTAMAEKAKKQRLDEQQRIDRLKKEAEALALAHKKQAEEEQRHLKSLAQQKEAQEKKLAEMKKQQQQEAEILEKIKIKKEAELAKQEQQRLEKLKEAQRQKQAAVAAADASKRAELAGVVDRYKALIIMAISRQWILPDNANKSLSSQFRIRLAPNGSVMEVSLARSSGDPILDRSAQAAIYKASPLPVPSDPAVFNLFREISLTVRPENARG